MRRQKAVHPGRQDSSIAVIPDGNSADAHGSDPRTPAPDLQIAFSPLSATFGIARGDSVPSTPDTTSSPSWRVLFSPQRGSGQQDWKAKQQHKRTSQSVRPRVSDKQTILQDGRDLLAGSWALFRIRDRRTRHRLKLVLLFVLAILLFDAWLIISYRPRGSRVLPQSIEASSKKPKIFFAGIHRNSEPILRSHWNKALLSLVEYYGIDSTYVSLYESGSIEDTKGALRELDAQLGVIGARRSIILDPIDQIAEVERNVTQKEDDWIYTPRAKFELRRIPYLSRLRNRVMQKLYEEQDHGRVYDYVIWINDVVFTLEDITTLITTNNGVYDAVCSLDFKKANSYYDTFALRDISGAKALPNTWPYFISMASRKKLISLEPVPVQSCWNGITIFPAAPFYAQNPLRFRGIPDSLAGHHLEGSECCLIHADNARYGNKKGVWLNPNVRVGYGGSVYDAVTPMGKVWPGPMEKVTGLWRNRLYRMVAWPRRRLEVKVVRERVEEWISQAGQGEVREEAQHCLINEMQVLEEAGWRHL